MTVFVPYPNSTPGVEVIPSLDECNILHGLKVSLSFIIHSVLQMIKKQASMQKYNNNDFKNREKKIQIKQIHRKFKH